MSSRLAWSWSCLLAAWAVASGSAFSAEAGGRLRKPEALLLVDSGSRLLAANRGTGTISIIDVSARRVAAEVAIGAGLADLKEVPGGRLLAVDQKAGELALLERAGDSIRRLSKLAVAADPARVVVEPDGFHAVVVSRWSRTLTFVEWDRPDPSAASSELRKTSTLALPFCPLDAAVLPGGSPALLVVADAFGGRLALVDLDEKRIAARWETPLHNLRALSVSPDGRSLAFVAQFANPLNRTSFDDVHWGLLMRSELHSFRVEELRTPGVDLETLQEDGRSQAVGVVGHGSADPSSLAFGPGGTVVVALAGVDEVASSLGFGEPFERLSVGRRPVATAVAADGRTIYTADSLDDSVTVVDLAEGKTAATIVLGPRDEPTPAEEGERLFTSALIGREGWMSCQTCHADGHTSSVAVDTMTDGSYGAPKQTPSLLGVGRTGPWNWRGLADRLEDQVRKSIETTLRGAEPTDRQVAAVAAYLRTLEPPPAVAPADPRAVARGRAVFKARDCGTCHAAPEYTTPRTYDVGLTDAVGVRSFNPPSLRGVSRRSMFLHDASIHSLPDVFRQARHPDGAGAAFSPAEVADLVAFLESL